MPGARTYFWADGTLDIGFHAVIGNGHPGSIEVSTGDGGPGDVQKLLGRSEAFDGTELTFTATALRNTAVPPGALPILRVTMFQAGGGRGGGGHINEQAFESPAAGFDGTGVARLTLTLSLVEEPQ